MTAQIIPHPSIKARTKHCVLDFTLDQEDYVRGVVSRLYMHEPVVCVAAACDAAGRTFHRTGSTLQAFESARDALVHMKQVCEKVKK